jgi:hydroxyacyl-ACP dehydratase HTD2-like protein with hotdog domain
VNYYDVYERRAGFLGTTPQERAFKSGILEFRRYLKYNQHTVRGLKRVKDESYFDGVILTDKEDENRVSQILLVDLETSLEPGDLVLWNDEHWLIYRSTTSSY